MHDTGMANHAVIGLVTELHNVTVSHHLDFIPLVTGLIYNTFVQLPFLQPFEDFLRLISGNGA